MIALWLAFTVAYFVFFYVFQDAQEIADASLSGYLEVVLLGVPMVVLLGAIMWLHESDVPDEIRSRIVGWTVGVAILFVVAMYTALFVIETTFDPGEQWLILLLSLGFGASAGSVMGIMAIRSEQRTRERNRSIRWARRKERQRSQLEHLNQYLRHEVLNEANKISGYATLLGQRLDSTDQNAEYLRVIRESGDEIAEFIESIRTILDAANHDPELVSIDLMNLLEREVERIDQTYSEVTVAVAGPGSVNVVAGELVDRVFRNLIENAIEHTDGEVSMMISVEETDEWVTVKLRDDGSGIPQEKRKRLFEPPNSGDHGYGLFLMRNLVEVYGGRLELGETGTEGTEFVVHLLADVSPDTSPSMTEVEDARLLEPEP